MALYLEGCGLYTSAGNKSLTVGDNYLVLIYGVGRGLISPNNDP